MAKRKAVATPTTAKAQVLRPALNTIVPDKALATAVGMDAGNKSMRAAGRSSLIGPLAGIGIGAAMIASAREAHAEGRDPVKAAVKTGAETAAGTAVFTGAGALAAAALVRAGLVTASRAVPLVNAGFMAAGAASGTLHGYAGSHSVTGYGRVMDAVSGGLKGAFDASLPGVVYNAGRQIAGPTTARVASDKALGSPDTRAEYDRRTGNVDNAARWSLGTAAAVGIATGVVTRSPRLGLVTAGALGAIAVGTRTRDTGALDHDAQITRVLPGHDRLGAGGLIRRGFHDLGRALGVKPRSTGGAYLDPGAAARDRMGDAGLHGPARLALGAPARAYKDQWDDSRGRHYTRQNMAVRRAVA